MANQTCLDTCECENKAHFSIRAGDKTIPKHIYGHMVDSSNMTQVKTPYGTFNVCRDCRNNCHKEYLAHV